MTGPESTAEFPDGLDQRRHVAIPSRCAAGNGGSPFGIAIDLDSTRVSRTTLNQHRSSPHWRSPSSSNRPEVRSVSKETVISLYFIDRT